MTANESIAVLWFRNDLRISDNPALSAAVSHNKTVVPIYIHYDSDPKWAHGSAGKWWLTGSLRRLDEQLQTLGSYLVIRRGNPASVLEQFARELKAGHVYYNRRYDPCGINEQDSVERKLKQKNVAVESFNASLLFEPELIKNRGGNPFKVFTPFWNACLDAPPPASPFPAPKRVASPRKRLGGESIERLGLEADGIDAKNWEAHWMPGAEAAMKILKSFVGSRIHNYKNDRDRPDVTGTSRLSPYLHFGEIGPRQIWSAVKKSTSGRSGAAKKEGGTAFLRQLGWREFAHYLLYHFPFTADEPLRSEYAQFPWKYSGKSFTAWCRAETGYPIVDAGMRELAQSGWMHNRVRMIAASFLVKDLLIPWQRGARWFWDRLVDADLANNSLGWQWVSGCGADAAPFFRIFNPVLQGRKFDPDGSYIRKWIPALDRIPGEWIHCPWEAPAEALLRAGVQLGRTYPLPIVDHMAARQRALDAYNEVKSKK